MKVFAVLALLACGAFAQEGPQCQAPNGGGPQSVLAEFASYIPLEQILEITRVAQILDPEVQDLIEYLQSDEFQQIATEVRSQPSVKMLEIFFCDTCYFDAAYYLNFLAGLFGFREVPSSRAYRIGGFQGMLNSILALIPMEQLQALFEEKLATDYYVQLAFQNIKSDEFRDIIETLQSNVVYNDMKDRLRGYGVDVDNIIDSLGKIFRPS